MLINRQFIHATVAANSTKKSTHRDHSDDRCDDVFAGFFVLISVNVIPALGIKTQQPNSSQAQNLKTPDKQVVVTLGREGLIQLDGQTVELDRLVSTIKAKASASEPIAVIVNSDKGAEVQTLVDVMDAIKAAGLGKVALAARERK